MSLILGKELIRWSIYLGIPVLSLGWINSRDNRLRYTMAQRMAHIERSGTDLYPQCEISVAESGDCPQMLPQ
ncbi:hypothetical protein FGIG_02544 [Fasciola gigantica]|uniref:Uncharacterized protein n=1 Tax=Fasciola gigantica TaxID=46835 RepID=A0A504Z9T0_FASGI|nr:hypothetical protein FGIG_02543 [Fasciola gigantica]TPP66629.1 hypothetical protein FGIG_02544 [Fasciola gigantica]